MPALLYFLSPERAKKKKKANMVGIIITKRKEKEEMNTTGNTAGLEAFFISFSFKSFVSVGVSLSLAALFYGLPSLCSRGPLSGL